MKQRFFIMIFTLAMLPVTAQKILHALCWATATYAETPAFKEEFLFYNPATGANELRTSPGSNEIGLGYLGLSYRFRYNFKEVDADKAFSISACPTFGLVEFYESGWLSFTLPLMIGLDKGAGATYTSTSDRGGFIYFGPQLLKTPIISDNSGNKLYIQFAMATGFRHWNHNNKMKEICMLFGFSGDSYMMRLSFFRYLNY